MFLKSILALHVICGAIALITGAIAMATKKGGKVHNLVGILFYWCMFFIFISTLLFFVFDPSNLKYQFFLGIGIVSFYPNWSGKRMLGMKKAIAPKPIDKIAAYLIGLSGLGMLIYAIILTITPAVGFGGLNILFFVFGMVSLANCYGDLRVYLGFVEPHKMHWFLAHGGKMMGAYSAAITAFCVNVVPKYLPKNTPDYVQIMTWILPGVTVGIVAKILLKKYKVKFAK